MTDDNNSILITNMMCMDNYPRTKVLSSIQRTNLNSYCMLNTDKIYASKNDIYTGLYNSVVFSYPEKQLLSYSPSKSISYSYFKSLFPIKNDDIVITEYIDGKVINLFYDSRIRNWEIASKEFIGGVNFNPKNKSLKEEFVESLGGFNDDLNTLPFLEYFPTGYSYSFILNKNTKLKRYDCYLISVFRINTTIPKSVEYIHSYIYESWDCINSINGIIKFPKKIFLASYTDIEEEITYDCNSKKYLLTHSRNGVKTTIENSKYIINKNIHNYNQKDLFRFLCLNHIDNTYELSNRFYNQKRSIYNSKQIYDSFITHIHEIYRDYYILKTSNNINKKYQKYLKEIHYLYYSSKINKKSKDPNIQKPIVRRSHIKEYFDKKSPHEIICFFYH